MKYRKMFPSKYLRAIDFNNDDMEVVIARIEQEMIGQGADAEEKFVMFFSGLSQGLVLNITNADAVAEMYGDDTVGWIGKSLILYRTKVKFGRDLVDAIRVKQAFDPVCWSSDFDLHGRTANLARNRKFETDRRIVDRIR